MRSVLANSAARPAASVDALDANPYPAPRCSTSTAPRNCSIGSNPEIAEPGQSDTALGNWYATAIFRKPQVALLVSERTLLPVLMPLAPAAALGRRFSAHLALVLKEHGVPSEFIAQEVWRMDTVQYAKTANRNVVGILNEFVKQAEFWLAAYAYEKGDDDDLLAISAKLAETPCSPLYKGPVSPDKALHELVKAGAQT